MGAVVQHESVGFRKNSLLRWIAVGIGGHYYHDADLRVSDRLSGGDRGQPNGDRDGLPLGISLREDRIKNLEFGEAFSEVRFACE